MKLATLLFAAIFSAPALAAECPLGHARYTQPGSDWQMQFTPLDPHGRTNGVAEYRLGPAEGEPQFDGSIGVPNGFGQSWSTISRGCKDDYDVECRFWEGHIYALVADGIAVFPHDPEQVAPRQILVPGFASGLWYSQWRNTVFAGDIQVSDVFTFTHCDE